MESSVYREKCEEFGLDYKKVRSILQRINKAMREADEMGIWFFSDGGMVALYAKDGKMQMGEFEQVDQEYTIGSVGASNIDGGGF